MKLNFKNDATKRVRKRTGRSVKFDDPACNVLDEIVALAGQNDVTISKIQAFKFVLKDVNKDKIVSVIMKDKRLINSHRVEQWQPEQRASIETGHEEGTWPGKSEHCKFITEENHNETNPIPAPHC